MAIREQAISGLKWTAAGKFGAQIITWAITLIVIRLLTPEDYGLLAMATVFIAFMLMLSEAGLAPALIQQQNLDEASLRSVFAIVIIINLSLLALLNLLAPVIAAFFDEERLVLILRIMSLQFLLSIFGTLPSVHMYRELKFKHLSLIHLVATISGSVLTLVLAFAQFGVWALVFGNLLISLCNVAALNIIAPFYLRPRFSLVGMRSLLAFGGNVTASRLLWFFFTQIDVIIVGKMLGKEMLGFYSVSMQLASMPVQRVSAIVNQVAFPVFSKIQHDHQQFRNVVLKAIRVLSLVAFPILWGISSVADELVLLVLGEKWEAAVLPLKLLALMMPFRMVANFIPTATDALGRPDIALKNVILASAVMPISFIVGSEWGLTGVVLAWVTVYLVVLFINIQRMMSAIGLGLQNFIHAIFPAASLAVAMYLAVWITGSALGDDINQTIKLSITVVTGMLVYGSLTLLFNHRTYQEAASLLWKK